MRAPSRFVGSEVNVARSRVLAREEGLGLTDRLLAVGVPKLSADDIERLFGGNATS
jgi:hypothetical protein